MGAVALQCRSGDGWSSTLHLVDGAEDVRTAERLVQEGVPHLVQKPLSTGAEGASVMKTTRLARAGRRADSLA